MFKSKVCDAVPWEQHTILPIKSDTLLIDLFTTIASAPLDQFEILKNLALFISDPSDISTGNASAVQYIISILSFLNASLPAGKSSCTTIFNFKPYSL